MGAKKGADVIKGEYPEIYQAVLECRQIKAQ
jgi:hypothetical protein